MQCISRKLFYVSSVKVVFREFNLCWCCFAVPWGWHQWSSGNVCLAKREWPTDYGRDGAWGRTNSRASQTWWHEWQVSITCFYFNNQISDDLFYGVFVVEFIAPYCYFLLSSLTPFFIDRWQSLNVRTLDIRDRLEDTGTEWRQLLMDLQEIIDWIARADQELTLQQPIGGDLESVQNQNEMHQVTIL